MSHVRACPFQEIGLGGWSVLAQLRLTGTFEAIRYRQVKTDLENVDRGILTLN